MKIENVVFHTNRITKNYFSEVSDYDIALFKLANEVDISMYTPICLPTLGQDYQSPDKHGNYRWATAAGKRGCKKNYEIKSNEQKKTSFCK